MDFQVSALDPADFSHLFGQDEASLLALGVERMVVDQEPGFPCRVSLADAKVGEKVLLLNYEHLPVATPYRSRHAIFVKEGASRAEPAVNEVPKCLGIRLLSVRAFDSRGMMVDAQVVEGHEAGKVFRKMLDNESVDYLHVHNAGRGCYAARVDRV